MTKAASKNTGWRCRYSPREVQGQRGFSRPHSRSMVLAISAGAPGFVEDSPHGDAEQDDDADVAHRVPEALAGGLDDGHRVKAEHTPIKAGSR